MRWEYKTMQYSKRNFFGGAITMDAAEFTELLNKLGNDGWELVCAPPQQGWHGQAIVLIFKRPRH